MDLQLANALPTIKDASDKRALGYALLIPSVRYHHSGVILPNTRHLGRWIHQRT